MRAAPTKYETVDGVQMKIHRTIFPFVGMENKHFMLIFLFPFIFPAVKSSGVARKLKSTLVLVTFMKIFRTPLLWNVFYTYFKIRFLYI